MFIRDYCKLGGAEFSKTAKRYEILAATAKPLQEHFNEMGRRPRQGAVTQNLPAGKPRHTITRLASRDVKAC